MSNHAVIRRLLAIAVALAFWMVAGVSRSQETAALPPLIPPKALDAIKRSQGQIMISEERFDGTTNRRLYSAFLVSREKRLLLSVLHGLPLEKHSAEHPGMIKFLREIPASGPAETLKAISISCTLKEYWYKNDLALLELAAEVPEGMEEVSFAKDVPVPSMVYAALFGIDERGLVPGDHVFFRWLPFYGVIVLDVPRAHFEGDTLKSSSDSSFYVFGGGQTKGGFSGAMFVNDGGDVVGIGRFSDGGYSGITSVKTITRFLEEFKKEGDTKR